MRDPDLIVRAQQAGMALESAWRRWRNLHGLGDAPLPPVSSYVGYSLDAPWGQPRVVFGICAEDAEQLAALLERQDRMNSAPDSAVPTTSGYSPNGELPAVSDAAAAGSAAAPGTAGTAGQGGGFLHVPAPAPASAGQQPLPASAGLGGHDHAPAPRHREPPAPSALTSPSAPGPAGMETPIALAASRAVGASMASRKRAAGESSPVQAQGAAETPAGGNGAEHPQDADDPPPGPGQLGNPAHPANSANPAHLAQSGGDPALDQDRSASAEPGELPGRHDHAAEHGSQEDAGSTEVVAFRPRAESALGTEYGRIAEADRQGTDFPPAGLQTAGFQAPAVQAAPGFRTPARTADGPERGGFATASADAATWAAGELPGQAAVTDTAV